MESVVQMDREQATDYQQKLHRFETDYFQSFFAKLNE